MDRIRNPDFVRTLHINVALLLIGTGISYLPSVPTVYMLDDGLRVSHCTQLGRLVLLCGAERRTGKGRILLASSLHADPKASQPKVCVFCYR